MKNITPTTVIIYLIGKPGVGKYTIAEELAAKHGFIVCDNQLVNHPIFELLQYNGYATIPDFAWDSIDRIRTEILVPSPSSDQPWGGADFCYARLY